MTSLADLFHGIAHKRLVVVDLPERGSNQHELNGVATLKLLFGLEEQSRGRIAWRYFADDHEPLQDEGEFTFYDARGKSAHRTGRSEWRFYYSGSFLDAAAAGDLVVLARSKAGGLFGLVFENNSAWFRGARILFGIRESSQDFDTISTEELTSQELEFLRREILSELELEVTVPAKFDDEQLVVQTFGRTFPRTSQVSELARSQVEVDRNEADETLVRWLDREEQLFRALESTIIRDRLQQGFASVDEFVEYSLSVQNRRKSRMGFALQNHLAKLFDHNRIRYTAQARTEGNNKPDFIFPSQREYHNAQFDAALLVMLGVKSTCKERWRQVLTEADRIANKHLCTLETGMSVKQTDEMDRHRLSLVLPAGLHGTYISEQRNKLATVADFIDLVRRKQRSE